MSLNSTTTKVIYDGDGATTEFPVTFKFLQSAHVQAILQAASGEEIAWTEGTHYTLTGAGEEEGGTLAVLTIPVDHTPQPGELLLIKRAVPETQLTELPLGGTLPSTTIEQMVDLLTMMVQAHSEEIARAVLLKATSQASGIEIPDPEAAKFLRWDALGDNLENAEITGSGSIGIPVSLAQGGTNATTAASALTNLGLSNFIKTLVDDADAATARTTLGLGSAAVEDLATGTWIPEITFATPGDLSVTYSLQIGSYTKIGDLVTITFNVETATFTHSTASGQFRIIGLPFASQNVAEREWIGALLWRGITKANYTDVSSRVEPNVSHLSLVASGSGQNISGITEADVPTGGLLDFKGTIAYRAA